MLKIEKSIKIQNDKETWYWTPTGWEHKDDNGRGYHFFNHDTPGGRLFNGFLKEMGWDF